MSNAARVLPAGPGELGAEVFPLRERLRFRDNFGLALLELRARSLAFQALEKGPWALFIAIAVHWQGNAEAWPSQDALARFSGWSVRAVRDQAARLVRAGFVRLRRERRADGSERIFYAPGLVTLAELAAFIERFPRERAKALRAPSVETALPVVTLPEPPADPAGAPPAPVAEEHRDQDQIKLSSCEARFPTVVDEQNGELTQEDREIARVVLTERMARKHPVRPAPRWFDAGELAMVTACSSALEGDRDKKIRAHRDAIAGAFVASKDGPPTVRFIWGKLEHFLDHVERGRRRRVVEAWNDRHLAEDASPRATRASVVDRPEISPAQMHTDLERLFGPGWRTTHVPR